MVAILALLVACAPTPATVTFDNADAITLGNMTPVAAKKATVVDANGAAIEGKAATCAAEGEAVTFDAATSMITAVKDGAAKITCKVDGTEVVASYEVTVALPAKVAISGYSAAVAVGGTVDLSGKVLTAADAEVAGAAVEWSSSDVAIATVEAGKVTAVAVGKAVITAKSGELTGTQEVEVVAAGAEATTAK